MSSPSRSSPSRRAVATPFGDIACLQSGSGPAAVFIHGLFLNADLWRQQLDALSDIRQCLAVDLLAHGHSPAPTSGELSITIQAEMILAVIDALELDTVDLVGNDSGGAIAQLVATQAPKRVRSLTLTNCDTHDNWPPAAFAPIRDMATQGVLAGALSDLAADPAAAKDVLSLGFEHPDHIPIETLSGFFAPFAEPANARAIQKYVAGMDHDVTVVIETDLARLLIPTLVVWGTADEFFDVAWARWLAATIPGTVRCVEVEGGKLFFPAERPKALNRELRDLWTNTETHTVVNRYLDAWNRHDLETVMAIHSPDTIFAMHTGNITHTGTHAVAAAFAADLAAWPDIRWEPVRRSVSGGRCTLETTMTATAASPLRAVGITIERGSPVQAHCVDLLTIDNQRITRKDTYLDVIELLSPTPDR